MEHRAWGIGHGEEQEKEGVMEAEVFRYSGIKELGGYGIKGVRVDTAENLYLCRRDAACLDFSGFNAHALWKKSAFSVLTTHQGGRIWTTKPG
ncbi:hypothetical protein [Desulfonatronospira thiodismutans]|uniref:hypothetical protein n=1 Tax=Desulfonatronospira thiodismutans TaxID=488939 RepID=UPI0012947133|nr:hypothetical protein [Desulfonatronospira thiodismutans]